MDANYVKVFRKCKQVLSANTPAIVIGFPDRIERTVSYLRAAGFVGQIQVQPGILVTRPKQSRLTSGQLGCKLAHIAALERVDQPTILFEDDVLPLRRGLAERFVEVDRQINRLSRVPGQILLGANECGWQTLKKRPATGDLYVPTHSTYGAFAYYIYPWAARLLIQHSRQLPDMPNDNVIVKRNLYHELGTLVCRPHLFIADVTLSITRGPRRMEELARRARWDLSLYFHPDEKC